MTGLCLMMCYSNCSANPTTSEGAVSEEDILSITQKISSLGWGNKKLVDSILSQITPLSAASPYIEGEVHYLKATQARWEGNYEQTLTLGLRALLLFQETSHLEGQARALLHISNALDQLGRSEDALFYTKKALRIARLIISPKYEGQSLVAYGRIALALNMPDSALYYLQQAESILRSAHSPILLGYTYTYLGEALTKQGELTRGLHYFTESRRLGQQTEHPHTQHQALLGMGRIYLVQTQWDKAINSLASALEIAQEQNWFGPILETATLLSEAFLRNANPESQAKYTLLAQAYADSIPPNTTSSDPTRFEAELQTIQQLLEEQGNKRQRRIQNIGWIIGSIGLLVLILLGYRNLKLAQANHLIQSRENELTERITILEAEQRKTQLREAYVRQREVSLEALDGFRNQMYIVLTQEMRDPLAALLTLQHDMLRPDLTLKEVKEIGRDSQRAMQTLFQLLQSIVFWIRIQKNGLQPKLNLLDNLSTLDSAMRTMLPVAEGYRMKLSVTTQKDCKFSGDSELLHQIIQLLIFNAIRYNQSTDPISCGTFPGENRVVFAVTIPLKERLPSLASIWNAQTVEETPNTHEDGTAGLTLWLCLRLILLMNGNAWEEFDEDHGQTLKFAIPFSPQEAILPQDLNSNSPREDD
ncbi:MAG TPA: hypothetical protein DCP28_30625 [Cytophagales bacterium]|nr:hypothetical protein [Cytophagales bacterium]